MEVTVDLICRCREGHLHRALGRDSVSLKS